MSDKINMTISIPSDDDGYVLLQCEHCGTYFKGIPSDIEDEGGASYILSKLRFNK